jgi:hypothetical protein
MENCHMFLKSSGSRYTSIPYLNSALSRSNSLLRRRVLKMFSQFNSVPRDEDLLPETKKLQAVNLPYSCNIISTDIFAY